MEAGTPAQPKGTSLSRKRFSQVERKPVRFWITIALPWCFIALTSSCNDAAQDGEASLRRAVERFWSLRQEQDHATIYDECLSLEARRTHGTRDRFVSSKGHVEYHWFDIKEVRVEGTEGQATVRYAWNPVNAAIPELQDVKASESTSVDNWILEDGRWRRLPRPLLNFPVDPKS